MSIVLRDCCRSTDVTSDGKTVTCRMSIPSTNYSEQVFSTEQDCFTVVVRIHRRCGGRVTVGIVGDDQTDECASYVAGYPEIRPSLGCSIADGEVQLRTSKQGRFFAGKCNTAHPIDVHMCFNRGEVSFRIDDCVVANDDLAATTFSGRYRIGVSVVQKGQCAEILRFDRGDGLLLNSGDVLRRLVRGFAGGGGAFPCEEYRGSGAFHFVDRLMDIYPHEDRQEFVCRRAANATVFSREVFSTSHEIDQAVAVTNLAGGAVALGIIGHEYAENGDGRFLGEAELQDSIALVVSDNEAVIASRDEVRGEARCDTSGTTLLRLTVRGGRLRFYVDMQEVECPWLETISLDGRYRLGVSLGREGQRAVYRPLDAGLATLQAALASGGEAAERAKAQEATRRGNIKVPSSSGNAAAPPLPSALETTGRRRAAPAARSTAGMKTLKQRIGHHDLDASCNASTWPLFSRMTCGICVGFSLVASLCVTQKAPRSALAQS